MSSALAWKKITIFDASPCGIKRQGIVGLL
jgi:hypothetical protein